MWTPAERELLRSALLAAARADPLLVAGALTGSTTVGGEDRWSDVDLAFAVAEGREVSEALRGWTDRMYRQHGAVHHVDVVAGATTYRVFWLPSGLQVDLAFTPAAEFGARGPAFRLLWGRGVQRPASVPTREHLIGMAWLYALSARTSTVRGKLWQAEYMVSAVRDHVLALASLRHGLPTTYGRGFDRLPTAVTAPLEEGLVRSVDAAELARALGVVVRALKHEIEEAAPDLLTRIGGMLDEVVDTARH